MVNLARDQFDISLDPYKFTRNIAHMAGFVRWLVQSYTVLWAVKHLLR